MKTVRRPPYPKWNPGYFPCSSLTPLPLSSRRPSVSFGGFGLSLVRYLRLSFGWDRMRQLLAVFKEGSTSDDALEQVYGFDSDGLDERWREYVGVRQSSEPLD